MVIYNLSDNGQAFHSWNKPRTPYLGQTCSCSYHHAFLQTFLCSYLCLWRSLYLFHYLIFLFLYHRIYRLFLFLSQMPQCPMSSSPRLLLPSDSIFKRTPTRVSKYVDSSACMSLKSTNLDRFNWRWRSISEGHMDSRMDILMSSARTCRCPLPSLLDS